MAHVASSQTLGNSSSSPNVLEHRVEGFELVDKNRPGYRKMIAIFLVDPALSILSTSCVSPQQLHWAAPSSRIHATQDALLLELTALVLYEAQCPCDTVTARQLHDEMLKERGSGAIDHMTFELRT